MTKRILAQLTMPRNNSWNNKWTGEEDKFTKVFSTSKKAAEHIGDYSYNFGDGWCANVQVRYAEPREKVTNRFFGYEWMIDSIKKHGKIQIDKED